MKVNNIITLAGITGCRPVTTVIGVVAVNTPYRFLKIYFNSLF